MHLLRRHLAVLALAMAAALTCGAAGVSVVVCARGGSASSSIDAADCCPPGSHPGQMCPMHKHGTSRSLEHKAPAFCGCRSLSPVGILSIGVLPVAPAISAPVTRIGVADLRSDAVVDLPAVPTLPPPRA